MFAVAVIRNGKEILLQVALQCGFALYRIAIVLRFCVAFLSIFGKNVGVVCLCIANKGVV